MSDRRTSVSGRIVAAVLAFAVSASAFGADVHIDVVRVNWWGSGNATDPTHIFVPTMGRRPKAVIMITSSAVGRDEAGTHGNMSIGFSDGTNNSVSEIILEDNDAAGTARAVRSTMSSNSGLIHSSDGSSTRAQVNVERFEDGGFILRQTASSAPVNLRFHTTCIVFSGADVQAAVGTHTLDNTEPFDAEAVNVGFQPECGFIASAMVAAASGTSSGGDLCWGAFKDEGGGTITNRGAFLVISDNTSPTSSNARFDNTAVSGVTSGGALIQVSAVATGSFSLLQTGTAFTGTRSPTVSYLALNLGGLSIDLDTFSTPTGATPGNVSDTGPGFKPQACVLGTTFATAANTAYDSGIECEHLGAAAYTKREEICTNISFDDNVSTSNAHGAYGKHAVSTYSGDGTEELEADFVSFDATGDTLNWTTGNATARLFWKMTFGEATTEHTPTRMAGIMDVTNPPSDLSPAGPFVCDEELQACIDYAADRDLSRMRSGGYEVYIPSGVYYLDGIPNVDPEFDHVVAASASSQGGLAIRGANYLTEEDLNSSTADYSATVLYWVGDATGPMVEFRNVDGLTVRNLCFHGGDNSPDGASGTAADAIDILTHLDRTSAVSGGLPTHYGLFERVSWLRGKILMRFATSETQGNVAEYTWRDCFFKGNHSDADPSEDPEYGVFIDHLFGQNYYFDVCWWREMNICIGQHSPGALATYGGSMADCHQYLELGVQNQSSAATTVDTLHQDGESTGGEGQGILFSSTAENEVKLRNVTYRGIVWPANLGPSAGEGGDTNEDGNRTVSSYSGTTLILGGNLNVRVGDRIGFWTQNSWNAGEPRTAETTVLTKTSNSQYTVEHTAGGLGLTVDSSLRASYGEPIFFLHDREHLTIENTWLLDQRIKCQRLVEAVDGLPAFAGNPFVVLRGCGTSAVPANSDLASRWIWQNGVDVYYDFIDCRLGYEEPMPRVTNVTPYIAELATPPNATNNVAAGYPVGSLVKTTSPPNRVYYHVADGVWVDITRRVPAPF